VWRQGAHGADVGNNGPPLHSLTPHSHATLLVAGALASPTSVSRAPITPPGLEIRSELVLKEVDQPLDVLPLLPRVSKGYITLAVHGNPAVHLTPRLPNSASVNAQCVFELEL